MPFGSLHGSFNRGDSCRSSTLKISWPRVASRSVTRLALLLLAVESIYTLYSLLYVYTCFHPTLLYHWNARHGHRSLLVHIRHHTTRADHFKVFTCIKTLYVNAINIKRVCLHIQYRAIFALEYIQSVNDTSHANVNIYSYIGGMMI